MRTPLALGAAVRAGSPGCSALGYASALASADPGCADAIASMVRGSAAGLPRAADLLGRLSCHPGAPGAVLARAAAASRAAGAADDGGGGEATGVFSHGSALRRLAFGAARTDASAACSARRGRAAPTAALATSRFWTDAEWRRGVVGAGPNHAPLHHPPSTSELVTAGDPALVRPPLRSAGVGDAGGRLDGATPCWNAQCERMRAVARRYSLCTWCGTFEFGAKPCNLYNLVSRPHALRCDNWGRGCPGNVSDFGPEFTGNATPGSPAFVLGQQVAAQSRASKRAQVDRQRAGRAARDDQGGRAGRAGNPPAAAAAPRSVAWGPTEYEPDGPPVWASRSGGTGGGKGGAERPVPALLN